VRIDSAGMRFSGEKTRPACMTAYGVMLSTYLLLTQKGKPLLVRNLLVPARNAQHVRDRNSFINVFQLHCISWKARFARRRAQQSPDEHVLSGILSQVQIVVGIFFVVVVELRVVVLDDNVRLLAFVVRRRI
jgi:hypothetical protein